MILRLFLLVLFMVTPFYVQADETKPQANQGCVIATQPSAGNPARVKDHDRLPTLKEFIHSKHHIKNVFKTVYDIDAWIKKNMW